jgi:hypothetical protein
MPLASNAVAANSLIAVEGPALVSLGFNDLPEISASLESTVHMEDTSPQPIVSGGGVAAAPTRSIWQSDCILLRMALRKVNWTVRNGLVAVVNGISW